MVRAQVLSTLTSNKWLTLKPTDQFFFFRKTPIRTDQFSLENKKAEIDSFLINYSNSTPESEFKEKELERYPNFFNLLVSVW